MILDIEERKVDLESDIPYVWYRRYNYNNDLLHRADARKRADFRCFDCFGKLAEFSEYLPEVSETALFSAAKRAVFERLPYKALTRTTLLIKFFNGSPISFPSMKSTI